MLKYEIRQVPIIKKYCFFELTADSSTVLTYQVLVQLVTDNSFEAVDEGTGFTLKDFNQVHCGRICISTL